MQPFYRFLITILPISIVLFFLQYYITKLFFINISFFYSTWSIYVFHLTLTLLSYGFLLFVSRTFADKTGFAFMGFSLLKMLGAIVFLFPLIQSEILSKIPDVGAFLFPIFYSYFLKLFMLFD
jgi:hypothetical protein